MKTKHLVISKSIPRQMEYTKDLPQEETWSVLDITQLQKDINGMSEAGFHEIILHDLDYGTVSKITIIKKL